MLAWPGLRKGPVKRLPHIARVSIQALPVYEVDDRYLNAAHTETSPADDLNLRMLAVISRGCEFGHNPDGGRVLEHQLEFRMRQSPNSARVPGRGWLLVLWRDDSHQTTYKVRSAVMSE